MGSGIQQAERWRSFDPLKTTPVLAGALEVFSELGFHGTTVREIARRAEVSMPVIYYHHENKEGIFFALLEVAIDDIAWRVRAGIAEADGDAATALGHVTEAIVLQMTVRHALAAIDPESRYLGPERLAAYRQSRRGVEDEVAEVVRAGVASGVFVVPDAREATRALLGMWQSITRWYRPEGPQSPTQIVAIYQELSLAAVGVPPGRSARVAPSRT